MQVFYGNSNSRLAKRLAKELRGDLMKVEISRFANDEAKVYIPKKVSGKKAIVLQSLSQPVDQHIVEFCLICDALKRLGVKKVTAALPWLAYSKQDKVFRDGEPLSVKVVAKIIQTASIDRILTLDLHNPAIVGFFDVPVHNISASFLFLDYFNRLNKEDLVVVAPDAGAVKSATDFAQKLDVPVTYIDKKRDLETGKVTIQGISADVSGKNVIMIDDMVVTGSTLIESSKFLKSKGVKKIYCAITHHLYVSGVQEKLQKSDIDKLIITDSIAKPKETKLKKTKIVSCAPLIAKEIRSL